MLEEKLQELGFSDKEAQAYVLLLELGAQPASVVARQMSIPRSSAQFILEQMAKRQIVLKTLKDNVNCYQSETPSKLPNILDREKDKCLEKFQLKTNIAQSIIPDLENLSQVELKQPTIVSYGDVDSVVKSYFDFIEDIEDGSTIYNYVFPADVQYKAFREGMNKFIHHRKSRDIFIKVICGFCEDAVRLSLTDDRHKRETRMSFENIADMISSELLISEDRILVLSYAKNHISSYIIFNKDLARLQSSIFDIAWKKAKIDHAEIMEREDVKKMTEKFSGIEDY